MAVKMVVKINKLTQRKRPRLTLYWPFGLMIKISSSLLKVMPFRVMGFLRHVSFYIIIINDNIIVIIFIVITPLVTLALHTKIFNDTLQILTVYDRPLLNSCSSGFLCSGLCVKTQ